MPLNFPILHKKVPPPKYPYTQGLKYYPLYQESLPSFFFGGGGEGAGP